MTNGESTTSKKNISTQIHFPCIKHIYDKYATSIDLGDELIIGNNNLELDSVVTLSVCL